MKIMQGSSRTATANNAEAIFSVSPTNLFFIADISKFMKFAWISFDSALAIRVFPQPGGPCNRTPLGGINSGSGLCWYEYKIGKITYSLILFTNSFEPAMFSQVTHNFDGSIISSSILFSCGEKYVVSMGLPVPSYLMRGLPANGAGVSCLLKNGEQSSSSSSDAFSLSSAISPIWRRMMAK